MLLPTSDTVLMLIQMNFDELNPYFLQMGANGFESPCLNLVDKSKFSHLLTTCGITTPKFVSVERFEDIPYAVENVSYPCMYKPSVKDLKNSFQTQHNGEKAVECADKETLRIALHNELKKGHKLIVQRKIITHSLDEAHSVYVYRDGAGNTRAIGGLCGLYRYPEHVGTAFILKPTIDPKMYALAEAVTDIIKWRGFLGYEFKWDSEINEWTIIEVNFRPWLTINYQAVLGVEFLDLLYRDAYGKLPPFTETLKIKAHDVYHVNLLASVRMFIAETGSKHGGLIAMLRYINDNKGKLTFSYSTLYDTKPGEREYEILLSDYPDYTDIIKQIHHAVLDNNKMSAFEKTV